MRPFFLQAFPDFNLFSTPLLILVLQGLVLAALLYLRFVKERNVPDLLLACIILIMCYHRTTYTIGFMGWYDTFRNTKVNYFLVSMEMLTAPLLYFYVKSVVTPGFQLLKKHFWHAVPWLVFFLVKTVIYLYDAQQPGFADVQNGYLVEQLQWPYLNPFFSIFSAMQMLLYLAFSFQLYATYKKGVPQFFSNMAYKELIWIRNFLCIYSFIFLYGLVQVFINELVIEMSWKQKWWIQFFSALAILYFGVKGYFTNFSFLTDFQAPDLPRGGKTKNGAAADYIVKRKQDIHKLMEEEKVYLNPELNLKQLAEQTGLQRAEVSEAINQGFGKNFNDLVNQYRIAEFKQRVSAGDNQKFSLVGLAFECGFNSKATFNRVFKKLVQSTPTQYVESLKN
ncbi:helix-turn-helix domain-containing protein [Croceitalea dokdonensis]|nr:AraC family transcriptional regulator [Croceitalea dokdonensis]